MTATIAELPLDERVVLALTQASTSTKVAAIRGEVEEAYAGLNAEADAADAASLSPLATSAQANQLRSKAADLRFEADRLEASIAALSARAAELREEERAAARKNTAWALTAERDALAHEIAAEFPQIVGQLTSLVKRIAAMDARCAREGLVSAEAIGRGVPKNFRDEEGIVMRIADMKVPLPDRGGRFAWGANAGFEAAYPGLKYLRVQGGDRE